MGSVPGEGIADQGAESRRPTAAVPAASAARTVGDSAPSERSEAIA
jgi:hypothetical protein